MDSLLKNYLDPAKPGSLGGVDRFIKHNRGIDIDKVKEWLSGENAYTLHKQFKGRFRRRKTFSSGLDDLWQIDLVDLSAISNYNDNYRYLLTRIDVFSRQADALPLKNKTGKTLTEAFAKLITFKKPNLLQSDKGSEFLNSTFQTFLKEHDIRFYTSENDDIKCALVERWHRTLKTKMWKYFTHRSTQRYLDVLQDLVKSYNDTWHSSIKMPPSSVTIANEDEIRQRLHVPKILPLKWKYKVNDTVRIRQSKRTFRKGYAAGWSEEQFTINSLYPSDPPTYILKDYDGEIIKGKFYAQELQKVKKTDSFVVDRVLKTRKRDGKTQYFVSWRGYPTKFNSWTDELLDIASL
jgi:Integrase core domain/Chromo (CHRromatin Organisation MOdifier) domain